MVEHGLNFPNAPGRRADAVFVVAGWVAALLLAGVFVALLAALLHQGLGTVSLDFLVSEPRSAGRSGGIAPILWSTLWILGVALIVAVPLGLGAAIWLAEFTRQGGAMANTVRLSLDVLAGVPSIVFGLFGNAFFSVALGLGFSILSGGLTLACMILPVFIRTAEHGLSAVSDDWRRGAAALGLRRTTTLWHVLLPAAMPALVAGLLLGVGRATAESAALVFTSGYVDRMPGSVFDSGRALAVHIYDLSMNVTGGDASAHASALVLMALILAIHLMAQSLADRWVARKTGTA